MYPLKTESFVETVGGDLTIKIEDNTEDGTGVYSEPVRNADQVLDDAEIFYAIVGNLILLKIKPYQEGELSIPALQRKAAEGDAAGHDRKTLASCCRKATD